MSGWFWFFLIGGAISGLIVMTIINLAEGTW